MFPKIGFTFRVKGQVNMHLLEVYLGLHETCKMEPFYKKRERFVTISYYFKKAPSQMFCRVLNPSVPVAMKSLGQLGYSF